MCLDSLIGYHHGIWDHLSESSTSVGNLGSNPQTSEPSPLGRLLSTQSGCILWWIGDSTLFPKVFKSQLIVQTHPQILLLQRTSNWSISTIWIRYDEKCWYYIEWSRPDSTATGRIRCTIPYSIWTPNISTYFITSNEPKIFLRIFVIISFTKINTRAIQPELMIWLVMYLM